jgi:hypothetical protein
LERAGEKLLLLAIPARELATVRVENDDGVFRKSAAARPAKGESDAENRTCGACAF